MCCPMGSPRQWEEGRLRIEEGFGRREERRREETFTNGRTNHSRVEAAADYASSRQKSLPEFHKFGQKPPRKDIEPERREREPAIQETRRRGGPESARSEQGGGTNGHLEHPFAAMDIRDRHPGGSGRDGRENRGGNSDRGYPPAAERERRAPVPRRQSSGAAPSSAAADIVGILAQHARGEMAAPSQRQPVMRQQSEPDRYYGG